MEARWRAPDASHRPHSLKRDFLKCDDCRLHKTKCSPQDRDWAAAERCEACKRRGTACGPNVRFSGNNHRPETAKPAPAAPNVSTTIGIDAPIVRTRDADSKEYAIVPKAGRAGGGGGGAISPGVRPISQPDQYLDPSRTEYPRKRSLSSSSRQTVLPSSKRAKIIPTPELGSNFRRLRCLTSLARYLRERQYAIRQSQPPIRLLHYDDVAKVIAVVLLQVRMLFTTTAKLAHQQIIDSSGSERYPLGLWRLNGILKDFKRQPPYHVDDSSSQSSHDVSPNAHIEREGSENFQAVDKLRCEVLSDRKEFYEEQDDVAEAASASHELVLLAAHTGVELPTQTPAKEAEALQSVCDEMSKILCELMTELPNEHKRWLPTIEPTLCPPIHAALLSGRTMVARHLQTSMKSKFSTRDILHRHALHIAAELSDIELLVEIYQQDSALLKERDLFHMTALSIAAYVGNLPFFKKLVELGADLDTQDSELRTILAIAAGAGNSEIVDYLLDSGLQPAQDAYHDNCSALHYAAAGNHEVIVDMLLENGASAIHSWQGKYAARLADEKGYEQLAQKLHDYETRQWQEEFDNLTPHQQITDTALSPDAPIPSSRNLSSSQPGHAGGTAPIFRDAPRTKPYKDNHTPLYERKAGYPSPLNTATGPHLPGHQRPTTRMRTV